MKIEQAKKIVGKIRDGFHFGIFVGVADHEWGVDYDSKTQKFIHQLHTWDSSEIGGSNHKWNEEILTEEQVITLFEGYDYLVIINHLSKKD